MARAELRTHQIPGQPEQPHPRWGVQPRPLVVAADVGGDGAVQVGFAGRQHQPGGGQLLDDDGDAGVGFGIPVAHGNPRLRRRPQPLGARQRGGVGFRRPQIGPHRLEGVDDFRRLFLHMAVNADADALDDGVDDAEDEFQLGDALHRHLLHILPPQVNLLHRPVSQRYIVIGKHPFPGHQHVVEHRQGVHFVEPPRQRRLGQRQPGIVGGAADEPQPRRGDGNGEPDAVLAVSRHLRAQRAVHRRKDFVGKGGQRRQLLGAPHDDALSAGIHHADGDVGVGLFRQAGGAVHLRMAESVGQAQIVFAHIFIVGADVGGVARFVGAE